MVLIYSLVVQVYIIGGDGTQRGAAVIYEVIIFPNSRGEHGLFWLVYEFYKTKTNYVNFQLASAEVDHDMRFLLDSVLSSVSVSFWFGK